MPEKKEKGDRTLLLERGSKLVMIGDSITDCERARPIGEGLFGAAGKGYVSLIDALLGAAYPELGVRVVNMGTGGNTVRDLEARWKSDVLDLKPEAVSIMIGDNDVWRQFDLPRQTESHVYPEEYASVLDSLVQRTQGAAPIVIMMSPFYIEPNRRDAMRAQMDRYGKIVAEVARERGALFVDTQAAFDAVLEYYYPATLSWNRVHPNHIGHMVIARAFLRAIGFAR